jgi:hypothetical protein
MLDRFTRNCISATGLPLAAGRLSDNLQNSASYRISIIVRARGGHSQPTDG